MHAAWVSTPQLGAPHGSRARPGLGAPQLHLRPRGFAVPLERMNRAVRFSRFSPATVTMSAGLAEAAFNFENVAVLPFWLLMMLIPKSSLTQRVMGSYL